MITITIIRPNIGMQILHMNSTDLSSHEILPDNQPFHSSDFPTERITITRKQQGHIVIGQRHHEKWVLEGFSCVLVDLNSFSEHWNGCVAMLFSDEYIRNTQD